MSTQQEPITKEKAEDAVREAMSKIPREKKLEMFIGLCQQGHPVDKALKISGMVTSFGYNADDPQSELMIEEVYYERCCAKIDRSRPEYPHAIIPDDDWQEEKKKPGDLKASQLYSLVDWLYFVRGMPLTAIAKSLQIPGKEIALVKAELSNEFSKTIRLQNAESYIGDLLRTKDLIRADLTARRGQLGPSQAQAAVRIDQLIFEMENRFIDRLQEIGLINKNLGKIDIHEEWVVSIDSVSGAPVNKKLEAVSQEPFEDAEVIASDETKDTARQQTSPADGEIIDEPDARKLLATVASATIKVGSSE